MITEIRIPYLGVNDTKALLVDWMVNEGASVQENQEICVIETSKTAVSVTADRAGYLHRKVGVGDEVHAQSVIGWIADDLNETPASSLDGGQAAGTIEITKKARELADALGIRVEDLRKKRGLIREKDVQEHAAGLHGTTYEGETCGVAAALPAGISPDLIKETKPLPRAQHMIKDTVLKSLATNAHSYVALDVCVDRALAVISDLTSRLAQAVRLNDALIYATARALIDFSVFNGFYWGDRQVTYRQVNIGLAMDFHGVLTVPVIRNANIKSLAEIAQESGLLQMKLFRKTLSPTDCEGGTFTISNLAGLGIHTFVPIIYGYQAAILAAGDVVQRPMIHEGCWTGVESITLGLSYDHRLNNGTGAARFLKAVRFYLQELSIEG